jgi:mannose-6-phosphate isomerase-like protein (cupin superfamily)
MKYKPNQVIPKGWGHELIIVNNDEFCSKIMTINQGRKCSVHYHLLKNEVFYLLKGKIEIVWSDTDDEAVLQEQLLSGNNTGLQKIILEPGEAFPVPRGRIHQFLALEDSELFEVSTTDFPEDSYRLIKGD